MKSGSTRIYPGLTSRIVVLLIVCAVGSMDPPSALCLAANIEFIQSEGTVDTYDFIEVTLKIANPGTASPFTDISVRGWFRREGGQQIQVDSFCDSTGGVIHNNQLTQ